jgi:hypothetical protein
VVASTRLVLSSLDFVLAAWRAVPSELHIGLPALDSDRAVYVSETNTRAAGTDLTVQTMADKLTVFHIQTEVV